MHVFAARYRLVAIPGIALAWAFLLSRIRSRTLRSLFCASLAVSMAYSAFSSPLSQHHAYTWKYALEFVERNASTDGAPVVVCSDFTESNSAAMPVGEAIKDSGLFSPLSYYKLSVPVVGLPRALNDEAMLIGSSFVRDAAERKQRFLAVAYRPSYKTLDWLAARASDTYDVRKLGVFDDIEVVEFRPK